LTAELKENGMKTTRLGLIGLGYMGAIHLKNCLRLKSAKVIAAADISKKALNNARQLGVKYVYREYEELLKNPEVEGVVISLPTHLHSVCAQASAEAKKDVFLEKPFARNPMEGETIVRACQKNDVKLMVGYPFRFGMPFMRLKENLKDGILGEAQIAHATMVGPGPFFHRAEGYAPRPVPSWWFDKELTGGGAMIDLGCHMVNLVRWYFGEAREVTCYVGHRFNLDFEDYAVCICRMNSGTVATVTVGWFSRDSSAKVEVFGTSRILTAKRESSNKILNAAQNLTGLTSKFDLPYLCEEQHFVNSIQNDRNPEPSGQDAVRDLELIYRAYRNSVSLDD
jgi:myo-inositol 2-dehydrogenase/D-chiro-inositol 1-dehydrogenase/scyllo-inositol 2-dehydrogenase (NAD+)